MFNYYKMINFKIKKKKKLMILETIHEHTVYIEKPNIKVNEYNQINLFDKIFELYLILLNYIYNKN